MSKTNWPMAILFYGISLLGSGCTVQLVPIPGDLKVPNESLPEKIDFSGVVTVLNNQPSRKKFLLSNESGGQYVADLYEWTQMPVMHTEKTLQDLGGSVGDNGSKILRLSVTRMKLEDTSGGQQCIINLNVETNDGIVQDYDVTGYATAGFFLAPRLACSRAITKATIVLLNDIEIRFFLEE